MNCLVVEKPANRPQIASWDNFVIVQKEKFANGSVQIHVFLVVQVMLRLIRGLDTLVFLIDFPEKEFNQNTFYF